MEYKQDFPIFKKHINLVYLDSAATTQKPKEVIDAITNFNSFENTNINRGNYLLAESAGNKYTEARKRVANFIGADFGEIVFTKSATEGFNLIANSIQNLIKSGRDEIVLSEMEHHSNLLPWQEAAKKHGFKLKFIPVKEDFTLDYDWAEKNITQKTALLSVTYVSNVFGTKNNVKKLAQLSRKNEVIFVIDATQAMLHEKIDVKEIGCDFFVFSAHKMFGPMGVGVVYGKYPLLDSVDPLIFGGGMVQEVSLFDANYLLAPLKFEAGTQNISGVVSFLKTIKYLEKKTIPILSSRISDVTKYCFEELSKLKFIQFYSPKDSVGIISFNVKGVHGHDVASILNEENICIRSGHHCCMPLMKKISPQGVCRASFSIYNTKSDVDKLVLGLKKVVEVMKLE